MIDWLFATLNRTVEPLHEIGQWLIGALDEQMDMVGHEAKGVHGMTVSFPITGQPFEIGLVVGVVEKGLSRLIAAHDDVVEQPCGKQSGPARHGRGYTKRRRNSQDSRDIKVTLFPFFPLSCCNSC